ncbi:MAG: glycosyltransferase family 4 protein [Bryobacteraceae bacterium]
MRICVDCTPFLVRSAGVKSYLYYLVKYLRATAGPHEILCFPFLDQPGSLRHDASTRGRLESLARAGFATRLNGPWNPISRWATRGADLFHASNLVRAMPRRIPLTTTVHDLTAFRLPALHTAQTIAADKAFFSGIVSRARQVIAVSNNTKRDLMEALGLPDSRITVIYSGVREEFFRGDPPAGPKIRAQYGLLRPYVLFAGTLEPRKNLARLLDAWAAMRASLREQYDLVLAGMPGWLDAPTRARIRGGSAGVRCLGYVAEDELPAIMAGATLFAYPSLYEGFGFPVAEAMAAGVPVLSSAAGSLPEVAGDAACYVDPLSVDDIRTALERLLTSPQERHAMIQRGSRQAQRYTWEKCARETWAVFEEAAEG